MGLLSMALRSQGWELGMSIRGRLRRLEDESRGCPECHLKPQVNYVGYPGEELPDPEHCPRCGRPLGFVIQVVYEGEGEG